MLSTGKFGSSANHPNGYIYTSRLKETSTIVSAKQIRATRKTRSAALSSLTARISLLERIDRKESIQLITSSTAVMPVMSSMMVAPPDRETLMEVSTIRQKPNRLEDVLSMWGDFSWFMLFTGGIHFITKLFQHLQLLMLHFIQGFDLFL